MMTKHEKIAESNRIEGIHRPPTELEVLEFDRFIGLRDVSIDDMETFVRVYQPSAALRERDGMDVQIGNYIPHRGGPAIREKLQTLLDAVNAGLQTPWHAHVEYERLHPFMDGNGRSGRMLWYWQMNARNYDTSIGFLHAFYYQTLRHVGR